MYKITIDYPNMPKGQEVSIPGLGTFENGSTTTVTKEQSDAFRAYQKDVGMPDKTLLESFKGAEYVTVVTTKEDPPSNQRDPEQPPQEVVTPPTEPPHVPTKKDGDK